MTRHRLRGWAAGIDRSLLGLPVGVELRRSEGWPSRVHAGGLDVGSRVVKLQVAGVGRQPGSDRAWGDLVSGGVVEQLGGSAWVIRKVSPLLACLTTRWRVMNGLVGR